MYAASLPPAKPEVNFTKRIKEKEIENEKSGYIYAMKVV